MSEVLWPDMLADARTWEDLTRATNAFWTAQRPQQPGASLTAESMRQYMNQYHGYDAPKAAPEPPVPIWARLPEGL